ncbi:MAG: alanine--tRNA ligase [Prevotellaceae bacterium]|jgi:alanyl-tRNA synthetase|nr:alanine--tRNA ligase [Prevotellaceae bacterium]
MTANQIRQSFLEFFADKGHTIVPSASMVVKNDPTLMFTNAGMNQFKDWFLGNTPPKHQRVTDTQKCLRVSGKHNDLEEVGRDTYHHTMFEMLGNWSFGDYFKKEAITWAWELLVSIWKLDPDRLYATVFEGASQESLDADNEASEIWGKFLPKSHILQGNRKDNFWEMGDTGPCGPCSEIHIDLRTNEERLKKDGALLVNTSHPLVIEIWNLVFIQYNRKADCSLEPLPQKHVDTGMGLERLCMALQGKQSNYDTDVFQGVIREISLLCGKRYGQNTEADVAMRVIADHIRAISFSIADGQLPSNVKAGYVIRRILRRAVRYGYTFLSFEQPFLHKLVPTLVSEMGEAFPELKAQENLITKVIEEEESTFLRTLSNGIRLLDTTMSNLKNNKKIEGSDAFLLYDTYGFPIDLTQLLARERGFEVDLLAFEKELERQKERSRHAASSQEGDWVQIHSSQPLEFVGYDHTHCTAQILRYRSVTTKDKTVYQLVLQHTPFYAESGGQSGDTGLIINESGEKIDILDTKKENNLTLHITEKLPSNPSETFTAQINQDRRQSIANNHTATHILHHALRTVLGNHIEQKGSLVHPDYLRFDFSHFEKVDFQKLREVEHLVNKLIRANIPLDEYRSIPIEEATKMGAIALFGEKYGDSVRVIKYGDSVELCGGTHVTATGNIGYFKILSEGAIAAGVRRIEAVTGAAAEKMLDDLFDQLNTVKTAFHNAPNLQLSIQKLFQENEALRKEVEGAIIERVHTLGEIIKRKAEIINGVNVFSLHGHYLPEVIRGAAMMLRSEMSNTLFVAGYQMDNKPLLAIMVTDDLTAKGIHAGNIIREAAKLIQGGGGGQPFFATAAGKEADGLPQAIEYIIKQVTS